VADWPGVSTLPPTPILDLASTVMSIVASTADPTVAEIGDPDGTRTVTSIVVLLVALGLALLLLAVWIFRTTRPDPDLLAPLEAMGERSWRRGDPVWQRRRLDELRPKGARPLSPSVAPPELDASFDAGPTASGFDDLRAPSPVPKAPSDEASAPDGTADESGANEHEVAAGDEGPFPDSTPRLIVGPSLDELGDDEFDPEALAAAQDELERELAASREEAARQLDLFDRDGRF
jgi:hypothetical protein